MNEKLRWDQMSNARRYEEFFEVFTAKKHELNNENVKSIDHHANKIWMNLVAIQMNSIN